MAAGLTRRSLIDPLLSLLHPAPIISRPVSAARPKNFAAPRWRAGVVLPLTGFKDHFSGKALRPVPLASCHPWLSPDATMIVIPLIHFLLLSGRFNR